VCGLCVRRLGKAQRRAPQPRATEEEQAAEVLLVARRLVHEANISAGGRQAVAEKLTAMVLAECAALSTDSVHGTFLWEVSGDFEALTEVVRNLLALHDRRDKRPTRKREKEHPSCKN